MGQATNQFEDKVVIVGVGLIGGSIAAAVRQRFPDCAVVGVGRSEDRLRAAMDAGLLTDWATECTAELLRESAIVVVCLPVNLIVEQVRLLAEICSDGVLITDAGSVKAAICDEIQRNEKASRVFIGSHPIAGGEQGGFEHAEANLFEGKVCVVSDVDAADTGEMAKLNRISRFWQLLGCRIIRMSAAEHDRVLALTSHLPHVMAAATTIAVGAENFSLTGSGFRDTTRIAAGSASLWTAILADNRKNVIAAINRAESVLQEFRVALQKKDDLQVESLLEAAARCRSEFDSADPE